MSSRADFALAGENPQHYGLVVALTEIWDIPTLSWVKNTGGGGGGGGAVTVADGADVAQGTTTDVAWVAGAGTVIGILKKIAAGGAGLTDAQLRATPVPVSGTFFQATQPVSAAALPLPAGASTSALQTQPGVDIGDVTVNNAAGAAAVNVQDGGNSLTVDGTVTTTPPANASTNLTQIVGTAADVNSGLKSAGTLRVVLATDQPALTNKLLVTPDSVALPANQSVNAAQFGGVNVVTGTGAGGAGVPRVTVSNDSNVIVTPPTLTKGTQGATGFSIQRLNDAGRTAISFYANNFASGATTVEKIITWDQSKGTGAITAATASYTITNGKTLRICAISVGTRGNATATVQSTVFSLRLNTAGAAVVTSTPILMGIQSATAAVASAWDRVLISLGDGYEIVGNGTISICMTANSTFVTNAPTWAVNLIGYEY